MLSYISFIKKIDIKINENENKHQKKIFFNFIWIFKILMIMEIKFK